MTRSGLEATFLTSRETLLRFLIAHGAGDAAEDVLQELWIRVSTAPPSGPIASPLSYLFRAANNLMVDRHRSLRQAALREQAWSDAFGATMPGRSDAPFGERTLIAREELLLAQAALAAVPLRAAAIFRRHRIDGIGQKQISAEMGLSLSTIESDLRIAYGALMEARRRIDEG
jgi:RNA polymerase sigma factor (sigma-70 family)